MSSVKKDSYTPNPLRFSPIPVAVLKDDQIPDGPKVLLGIILDYAWSDTSTWVSVETLALDVRRSVRTIQMWLSCLKGHRWIRVEPDKSVPTGRRIVLAWRDRGSGNGEVGTDGHDADLPDRSETARGGRNPLRSQGIAPDPDSADRGRQRSTTDAEAPETQQPRPPVVVVDDDRRDEEPGDEGRETSAASPETVKRLVALGVTRSVAEGLARDYEADCICRQIEALPHRNPKDRAATLVASIQGDWAMPEGLRRSEEAAARHAEEQRARCDAEARKRTEKLHERQVSEFWNARTLEEQERLLEEAIEHAEPEMRDFIRKVRPHEPLYRAYRVAVRDEHIRRVLGLPPLDSR